MSDSTQLYVGDILVVGDWFVDEYWFVVRHHSEISSHIKPYHYRIFTDAKHIVRDLCGGGFITRVLYELREYNVENLSGIIKKIEPAHEFAHEFAQNIIPLLKEASDSTLKDKLGLFIKNKGKIKELKENNGNLDKNCCSLQAMSLLNETIKHLNDLNELKDKLKNELKDKPNYIDDLINQLKNKYQSSYIDDFINNKKIDPIKTPEDPQKDQKKINNTNFSASDAGTLLTIIFWSTSYMLAARQEERSRRQASL